MKRPTHPRTVGSFWLVMAAFAGGLPVAARADEVTDWNKIMFQAALVPPATSPLVMGRVAAIVQVSVFEAVNGIERRYAPVHAAPLEPVPGASLRAAAVQAAYAVLVRLYPAQKSTFDAKLAASLAAIGSGPAAENSSSPTFATPHQGLTSFARCSAASRSGTSSASAKRSRTRAGSMVVIASLP